MVIYPTNGNPIIALVVVSVSTFKDSAFLAAFRSISLSFSSEAAAKNFFEEARYMGGQQSRLEPNNVVVFIPDFGGGLHAVKVVYHAVNSYKDSLTSVDKIEISAPSEEGKNLLKDLEEYVQRYLGWDAITVK